MANAALSMGAVLPGGSGFKNGVKVTSGIVDEAKDVKKIVNGAEAARDAAKVIELTRSQRRNINTLDNIVKNNLTDGDFSCTLADLQGNPIPNPNGGYWDHLTEMRQSYTGLQSVRNGLEGSLKNPNLSTEVREVLQENLEELSII